jgi:hypothetical protein
MNNWMRVRDARGPHRSGGIKMQRLHQIIVVTVIGLGLVSAIVGCTRREVIREREVPVREREVIRERPAAQIEVRERPADRIEIEVDRR